MELLGLLVVGIIVWFAFKNISNQSAQAKAATAAEGMDEDSPKPVFAFKGQYFVDLRQGVRKGGDYGVKFKLNLYRQERFIRVWFYLKKEWVTYDIDFEEIVGVRREVPGSGEYGDYVVITIESKTFPQPEIVIRPGRYELLDALNDALRKSPPGAH